MQHPWLYDLESLEEISQNVLARRLFLKLAAMSREGTLATFVSELEGDDELDDDLKGTITELAHEPGYLFAVEEYLRGTQRVH